MRRVQFDKKLNVCRQIARYTTVLGCQITHPFQKVEFESVAESPPPASRKNRHTANIYPPRPFSKDILLHPTYFSLLPETKLFDLELRLPRVKL